MQLCCNFLELVSVYFILIVHVKLYIEITLIDNGIFCEMFELFV